jgi:hypothetical protein
LLRGNGRNLFSREWKRYGNDLRKVKTLVKILCFIPDFLEGWEISIFFIPFPYVPFLFHAVPRKKNAGTGEKGRRIVNKTIITCV